MKKSIVAIEQEGMNIRTLSMEIIVHDETIDLKEAIKKACTEYVNTKPGRDTYLYNCELFNWADFSANVPNEICRKYGFEKAEDVYAEEEVAWDEQLVNEEELVLTDEMWEDLKKSLFMSGRESLEIFLDYELEDDYDKDVVENRLNAAFEQMSPVEQMQFYHSYV